MTGTMQHSNAMKVILVLGVNLVAAISYLLFAFERIDWTVVLLIAVGSLVGGLVGAKVGRRLSPVVCAGSSSSWAWWRWVWQPGRIAWWL